MGKVIFVGGVLLTLALLAIWIAFIPNVLFKHFGKKREKADEKFSKIVCPFCGRELPEIKEYNGEILSCECGAEYWAEERGEYWDTFCERHCDELPATSAPEGLQIKLIDNYDWLGDSPEEVEAGIGDEIVVVFVKKTMQ